MYNDSFKTRYKYAPVAISISNDDIPTAAHIHNEIEMLYIKEGSAEIRIGEESYRATAGELYFINPYEVHSVTEIKEPYYHQCICFDCSLIADKGISEAVLRGTVQIPHRFTRDMPDTDKLIYQFERLFKAAERPERSLIFESSSAVSEIFASIIKNNQLKSREQNRKASLFCQRVIEYVSGHYTEKISSKNVAEELFYTQNHFCRTFVRNFGVSFSQYLNMYRILVSTELLSDSALSISDVAYRSGFIDTVYFAKCFRKYKGTSPTEYRKNQYNT